MNVYKKVQQILYLLRKVNAMLIDKNFLFVFLDSFVNIFGETDQLSRIYILARSLDAVHPIPVWSNYKSQVYCNIANGKENLI